MTAQVSCYGRLGQDPQERTTKTGKTMAFASLAVELPIGNSKESDTEWVGLVVFGRTADALLKHQKGDLLSVSGTLKLNRWTKDGVEQQQFQVVCDSIVSAKTVRPGGGRKKQPPKQPSSDAAKAQMEFESPNDDGRPFDDDIPF